MIGHGHGVQITRLGLPDEVGAHGKVEVLLHFVVIDKEGIKKALI